MPNEKHVYRREDLPNRDGCCRQASYPQLEPMDRPTEEDSPCVSCIELLIRGQLLLGSNDTRFQCTKCAEDA